MILVDVSCDSIKRSHPEKEFNIALSSNTKHLTATYDFFNYFIFGKLFSCQHGCVYVWLAFKTFLALFEFVSLITKLVKNITVLSNITFNTIYGTNKTWE